MKRAVSKIVVAAGVLALSLSQAANAAPTMHPYKAVYEESGAGGTTIRTYYYDGKGRGRTETERDGRKTIGIADLNQHKMYICDPRLGAPIEMPLDREMENSLAGLGDSCRKVSKPLGKKIIDGHPCTGLHYDLDGYSVDYWQGEDIGVRVLSVCNNAMTGIVSTKLRSYSAASPDAKLFQIP